MIYAHAALIDCLISREIHVFNVFNVFNTESQPNERFSIELIQCTMRSISDSPCSQNIGHDSGLEM